jgi:hypothetical protein
LYDLVALFLCRSLGARLRKITTEEVDENVGKGFQIVMARMFNTTVVVE